MSELSGILCLNKPQGLTSHTAVGRIRKLYDTKRVGHTGTLDAMATGVLTVLIGRAAKAAEYIVNDRKEYTATLRFGLTTDTGDIAGTVLNTFEGLPKHEDVMKVIHSFKGEISQIPPMYSAIKINGQKLLNLARKGIEIDRESRLVNIYEIAAERINDSEYLIRTACSKGTYIRTLCMDIGEKLNNGAVMTSLIRTRNGRFGLDNSYTLEQLGEMSMEERVRLLMPLDEFFNDFPSVELAEFYYKLASSGTEIYQKKINTDFDDDIFVKLYHGNEFFALAQVTEFESGSALKPVKQFVL